MINNHRYYKKRGKDVMYGYFPITLGMLNRAIAYNQRELEYRFRLYLVASRHITDARYHQKHPFKELLLTDTRDIIKHYMSIAEEDQKMYGTLHSGTMLKIWTKWLSALRLADTPIIGDRFNSYCRLLRKLSRAGMSFADGSRNGRVSSTLADNGQFSLVGSVAKAADTDKMPRLSADQFVKLMSRINMLERHEGNKLTVTEYMAVQIAFEIIRKHGFVDADIVPWGRPGFRKIQTQASITDPGMGHITGTLNSMGYINGTNVHIEYLERGTETDREKVEPYRIPDISIINEVKMLTGDDTSVSSYVGRPMFESSFKDSFIKSLHTMSAAVSAIFMSGLSECKIAMEHMTTSEMVKFMRALSANAIRDKSLQVLAGAFNVNTPLIDDRKSTLRVNHGKPVKVTCRMNIAKLGIELAKEGNFDKVTFDGTANTYPSRPIMEQLGYKNALTLVHLAHERGLLTYFSAGFRYRHLKDIVLSGTDGIGLGGAQILRFMDRTNGYQGPFKPSHVRAILNIDSKAENSVLGKGTQLLTRMDEMHFEHSLPADFEHDRTMLFKALLDKDINKVKSIMTKPNCRILVKLPSDVENPLVCEAKRILKFRDESHVFRCFNSNVAKSIISGLEYGIKCNDYDVLYDLVLRIEN